jgi:tRNA nucleotidyltransferase (CCA-adding enzyme)
MAAALQAAAAVDSGAIAREVSDPARIKDAVHQARVAAVKSALKESDE